MSYKLFMAKYLTKACANLRYLTGAGDKYNLCVTSVSLCLCGEKNNYSKQENCIEKQAPEFCTAFK